MAQHPQATITTTRTVAPPVTPTAAPQAPTVAVSHNQSVSPGAQLAAQRRADLLASVRQFGPTQQAGIMSGKGNQGSANTAHLAGHAGTGCGPGQVPRQLKFGTRTYQQ